LVAEEGVLGDERRLATRQIGDGADRQGRDSWAGGGEQPPAETVRGGAAGGWIWTARSFMDGAARNG